MMKQKQQLLVGISGFICGPLFFYLFVFFFILIVVLTSIILHALPISMRHPFFSYFLLCCFWEYGGTGAWDSCFLIFSFSFYSSSLRKIVLDSDSYPFVPYYTRRLAFSIPDNSNTIFQTPPLPNGIY